MIRKILATFLVVFICISTIANTGGVLANSSITTIWLHQFGTSSQDSAANVAVDGSDNVYVIGWVWDGQALPGQTPSGGMMDAYIRKYDSAGVEQWTHQYGNGDSITARDVAVDSLGNAYIVGDEHTGMENAYIRKYSSAGVEQWIQKFNTGDQDFAYSVAVDSSGNAYMVGSTGLDAFIRKYDSAGELQWAEQFGSSYAVSASGVAVDSLDNVYIAGTTYGTLPGQTPKPLNIRNAYIRKYDSTGVEQWTHQFDSSDSAGSYAYCISVDGLGNAYIAGGTSGTFTGQTASGGTDGFVRKYDSTGVEQWTRQFGSSSNDIVRNVIVDDPGNTFLVGETWGSLPGQTNLGSSDAYIHSYNDAGVEQWTYQFGTISGDMAWGVALDSSDYTYVAGTTSGSLPGQTALGGPDAFIIVLGSNQPPVANANGPYIENEGTEITFNASSSSDPDSDSLQYRWDFENDGNWDTDWSTNPIATHTWFDDHTGTVKLEVDDGTVTDTDTTDVIVNNVVPEITSITLPIEPVNINDIDANPITLGVAFSDVGTSDTHTSTIDWGDLTETTIDPASSPLDVSHEYTSPGVYAINLTVRDDDGGLVTEIYKFVVVYDPAAGFATGAGWFVPGNSVNSDPGDNLPGLDQTSRATFGFVVKYRSGASTTPSGQLEFQYHVGDFRLYSSDYDWLVVTNANWAKFHGLATIEGHEGLYPFRVDCRDSSQDRFIIMIWDLGADPDIDDPIYKASGDLCGGQIKIHR